MATDLMEEGKGLNGKEKKGKGGEGKGRDGKGRKEGDGVAFVVSCCSMVRWVWCWMRRLSINH